MWVDLIEEAEKMEMEWKNGNKMEISRKMSEKIGRKAVEKVAEFLSRWNTYREMLWEEWL